MLKSIEGVFRDGRIELLEPAPNNASGRVIVTFLAKPIELVDRGVDDQQVADLRHRLKTFADDWDSPEMDVYDAV